MTNTVGNVLASEVQQQLKPISQNIKPIASSTFMFVGALDGTNNVESDPSYSNDGQSTAVGALYKQMFEAKRLNPNANLDPRYYPGVGTPGTELGSSISPAGQSELTARQLIGEYGKAVDTFLSNNPDKTYADVTLSMVSFSRGIISAALVSQMLRDEGLVYDGRTLIPPGEAKIALVLSISPVSTGSGDQDINLYGVDQTINVLAANDYRGNFIQDLFANASNHFVSGTHGDVGALYDRGISGIALQEYTNLLNKLRPGMAGEVLENRQYDGRTLVDIHEEPWTPLSFWNGSYGSYAENTPLKVIHRGLSTTLGDITGEIDRVTVKVIPDGYIQQIAYVDGRHLSVQINQQGSLVSRTLTESTSNGGTLETTTWPNGKTYKRSLNADGSLFYEEEQQDGIRTRITWGAPAVYGSDLVDPAPTDTTTPHITVTDTSTGETREQRAQKNAQLEILYSDMAGFIRALHGGDKLNTALYGAKIVVDGALVGDPKSTSLNQYSNTLNGLSASVGIVAGLRALGSEDALTQATGLLGLISSSNQLAGSFGLTNLNGDISFGNTGNSQALKGFLGEGASQALQIAGAVLSLANLANLDDMIEQGQVGSVVSTLYGAAQAISTLNVAITSSALTTANAAVAVATTAAETTAAVAAATEAAAAASAAQATAAALSSTGVGVIVVVAAIILNQIFAKDAEEPPPPPPYGSADFTLDANGQITLHYGPSNPLGQAILEQNLPDILNTLKQQLDTANATNTDPARALHLIANRIPKIYIQSWQVGHNQGNGESNYYFLVEQHHPQNGQNLYTPIARQDLKTHFSGLLILPEALVQDWEYQNLQQRYGPNEANWKTEGQYLSIKSAIESQRQSLTTSLQKAEQALEDAKNQRLTACAGAVSTVAAENTTSHTLVLQGDIVFHTRGVSHANACGHSSHSSLRAQRSNPVRLFRTECPSAHQPTFWIAAACGLAMTRGG